MEAIRALDRAVGNGGSTGSAYDREGDFALLTAKQRLSGQGESFRKSFVPMFALRISNRSIFIAGPDFL